MSPVKLFPNQIVEEISLITKPLVITNTPPPQLKSVHIVYCPYRLPSISSSPMMAASLCGRLLMSFNSFPLLSFSSIVSYG